MDILDDVIHNLDELSVDLHFDVSEKRLDKYMDVIASIINQCEQLKTILIK